MEGVHWRGLVGATTLPGKVAIGAASKPPARHAGNVSGGDAAEVTSFVPARPEECRKIFGTASACSIPVLDLPPPSDNGYGFLGFAALDYLDIFGGFDGRDFAVSYEDLFFSASQESSGFRAPPLPSEPDNPPLSANTGTSRGLKVRSCLKQEMPLPGVIAEWPGGDNIGSSLSGVAYCLSDGTKQTNVSHHTASWSSKDNPVNETTHENQVYAISGSTFVVDKPNTQVDTDICFHSIGSKETAEGQCLKKTVLSTSFCGNVKHNQNDMKAEPRHSKLEFSVSRSAVYEQNESFTSGNWSTVSRSNVISAKLSNNHSLHEDFVEKKTEGKWQNNTAQSTVMSMRSGNDLKVQCITSEDIPANEVLFSFSSSDHAATSGPESFPDHLTTHVNFDAVDVRTAEANHFKKSMSQSPSCASSQSSDNDNKAEEKQFSTMFKFLENSPVNESHRSHVSNIHSISSWHQSYPDGAFLTVSDIILQTQASQRPPPARPPPARSPQCSDHDVCMSSANCHNYGIVPGATFESHSFKHAVRDISPPSFDAEVNESSTAVASVAAIKEAMELPQARLKSAKLSMEKKDNLQIGLKLGVIDGQRSIERDEDKTIQDNQRNRAEVLVQLAQKNTDGKVNEFAMEKMMREFRLSMQAANFKDKEINCGSVDWSLQEMQLEEVSEEALGHEETEKKMNITEKYMEDQEGVNGQKVWGKSFGQGKNDKELTHALCVPADGIHLLITSKNQETGSFNCIKTNEYACFREGNEMEPGEARLLFEPYERKKPNITQQTFEWAENENELKAAHEVHDRKGNGEKLNEVQESDGCNGNEKKLKEIQKLPLSPEKELQQKDAEPNIAPVADIPDDVEDSIVTARGDYKKKINGNIKEVQVVLDPRQASLLGKQWHICKAGQESIGKRGTEWLDENVSEVHETKGVNKERMEIELPKHLEEEKERGRRKLGRNERARIKLEEENDGKRIEIEEEKEGVRIDLEEEKDRRRRGQEEEKKIERRLEKEKEREKMFQDEKDEQRKYEGEEKEKFVVEERERKKTEEERERRHLDEKQERKKLEEEMERRKLEKKEREKRRLEEEERERKKLEEKEGERRKLEEEGERRLEKAERERRELEERERERRRMEEDDGDTKLEGEKDGERRLEEEERKRNLYKETNGRKIEEKERERRKMEQEREMERRMMEEEKDSKKTKSEEEKDRERDGDKDRQAVKGDARETAFVEAQERAQRVAVEMITVESQQRVLAEAQENVEKTLAETLEKSLAEKTSRVARLRAEHAAAERAMAEVQEHAVGMVIAEKTNHDARECEEKFAPSLVKTNANLSDMRDSDLQFQNLDPSSSSFQTFSESFHASCGKFGGSEVESSIRCKARMERHKRTVERVAKALVEKNMRDIITQREQAERNRLAETLDADVRRWSNGKEGNLRALLSTLQYILGPESGWQPISLTDVITASAVKKAYRKAMLCVHPDKLQQRRASIQQQYICEKVFDLLKEAWNKFNSEEW